MEDKLIEFETAKLAKEKGFDIKVYFTWLIHHAGETLWDNFEECQFGKIEEKDNHNSYLYRYSAPTQSLLQKWLREVHSIHIQIQVLGQFVDGENKFYSQVIMFGENKWISKFVSSKLNYTYEQALEKGLQEALKLIQHGEN